MRSADAHLTPQELYDLLFAATDSNVTTAGRDQAREAQQHLDRCDVCQAMAKRYANADSVLKALGPQSKSSQPPDANRDRGGDCPPDQTWLSLAAGLIDDASAAKFVSHAAGCDHCGPLLKESMYILAEETTAEEEAALASLASARPDWQRELGKKLAAASRTDLSTVEAESSTARPAKKKDSPSGKKNKFTWFPRFAFAAAAVALIAVAGWVVWQKLNPDPNRLLAEAYGEHRTLELRMPGAKYGPLRVERGAGQVRQNASPSLLEAEAVLARGAGKHPEDPKWLQAQARAALLEWDYEGAIKKLDDALLTQPEEPALLIDRATALYERAESLGRSASIDYGYAAEDLTKVLRKNPDDPVALFNRGILYEKLNSPNEAIADFEHYLKIDPKGPWANEAAQRLQRLRELVRAHDVALTVPLEDPESFVDSMKDLHTPAQIDDRIEDYVTAAMTDWLPKAFPVAPDKANRQALLALKVLAVRLAEQHKDKWLHDLVDSSDNSPVFASAVNAMRVAVLRSAAGDANGSLVQSQIAATLWRRLRNRSGVLRAQVERVHALQRAQRSNECIAEARTLQPLLQNAGYSWMYIQLSIDRAACAVNLADFESSRQNLMQANHQTVIDAWPVLHLRALGLEASIKDFGGDLRGAWATNQTGLDEFWKRPSTPPVRAHQFYDVLTYSAEKLQLISLSVAFAYESADLLATTGNVNTEILVREHLAEIAVRAGQLGLAESELKRANVLSGSLSNSQAQHAARIYSEITVAAIDSRQGKLGQAEERLRSIASEVDAIPTVSIGRGFHTVKAELRLRQGRSEDAEIEYLRAIEIVESAESQPGSALGRESWSQENGGLYRSLVELELTRSNPEKALAVWEWYKARSFDPGHSAKTLAEFLDRNRLRQLLAFRSNETLVSYALFADGLATWVASDHQLTFRFTPLDPAALERLSASFWRMCADESSPLPELRANSRKLFDILVRPVADQIPAGRTLVIESDELLGDLPFQALAGPGGHYVSETHSLVFSMGVLHDAALRPLHPISSHTSALIVASTATELGNESATQANADILSEANELAAKFSQPKILQGPHATAAAIERALPRNDVFHYGGHALSNVNEEGLLILASGSSGGTALWDATRARRQIFGQCRLIVLAACSTGRAYMNRRESHGQMIRAMLAAGVSDVVASRWDVDSKQTRLLMGLFYNHLFSGMQVASALRQAELDVMADGATEHPYYWAAFSVFGHA